MCAIKLMRELQIDSLGDDKTRGIAAQQKPASYIMTTDAASQQMQAHMQKTNTITLTSC